MPDNTVISPLAADKLTPKINRRILNSALKDAQSMDATFVGQERAREALTFGLGIDAPGYNLYVMGEQATGRFTLVKEYIEHHVNALPTPDDLCYINNFEEEREPYLLRLHPAEGRQLQKDIEHFIDELLDTFPAAFDNPGYQRKKAAIERSFEQQYDAAINSVEVFAQAHDVAMYEEAGTISFAGISIFSAHARMIRFGIEAV